MRALWLLALCTLRGAAAASLQDLHRAKTKKPRDAYRGPSQTEMSRTLNKHLRRDVLKLIVVEVLCRALMWASRFWHGDPLRQAHPKTRPCESWSLPELQDFMATILGHRSHDLQQIYEVTADRRSVPKDVREVRAQWTMSNSIVQRRLHLLAPQREAHCREALEICLKFV